MHNISDQQHIADSWWQKKLDISELPQPVQKALGSHKHSSVAYGQRMRDYMRWLQHHTQSHNPNYKKRYALLQQAITELTPHQAYILRNNVLGKNMSLGFETIPAKANLVFPRDHTVKTHHQVGWHFFVGSVWGEDGQEYGVELMFFGIAVLPPALAKDAGLNDVENQIIEMQLAISKAGESHHQADPVIIAGTSGLLEISEPSQPFRFAIGKNHISSIGKKGFFPLHIQTKGWDRGSARPFEIGLDLRVSSEREILYQGDQGAMPSLAGFGTLYYSIPNLQLLAGSSITYGGKQIKLKKGLMWFDHQWGFMGGNPNSAVLRAATNIGAAPATGWDWYMHQFDGNRQTTVFATHNNKYKDYYFQSSTKPPPTMHVPIAGKYMDEKGNLHNTWGELSIDGWAKAETSSNPKLYPITHVWHPNHWHFKFDQTVPEDIREFTMEQIVPTAQTNFFANGAQYNEGAVYLYDMHGKDIGRGFAEAVAYANTTSNAYRLLGFKNNKKLLRALDKQTASLPRQLWSLLYMLTHQKQLKHILKTSAGMELMAPKPKGHVPRHG